MNKITVVGAGNVGAQCLYRLAQKGFQNLVFLDIVEGLPQGKAIDIMQTGAIEGFSANIIGTNNYEDTKGSQVVIITAGLARKPGMSRDDLIAKNVQIMQSAVKSIINFSPNAILIVITNPLDVMTYYAYKISGLPSNKVLGMAPLLDAARMQYFIAKELNMLMQDIHAEVLGSHGDLMVPVPGLCRVKGKPLTEAISQEQIKNIIQKTKDGGAEIVQLLKTASAYYAPGSAAAEMAEAIALDSKKVIATCCYLTGQYELSNIYLGVHAKLGKNGVEEIIEVNLNADEKKALHISAKTIEELCKKLLL